MSWSAIGIGLAAVATAAVYALLVRPWRLDWGATNAERRDALPGDDVMPNAGYVSTRAVTIDAPPERVWPWLVEPLHAYMETGLMRGLKERAEQAPVTSTAGLG